MKKDRVVLGMIMLILAYEWLAAAWEKFSKPDFMNGFQQTISSFASTNPHTSYANFLNNTVLAHSSMFANLTRFSELLVGLGLLAASIVALRVDKPKKQSAIAVVVLLGLGFFLNVNFYLAAGWTNSSVAELNVVMAVLQLILIAYYGIDLQDRKARKARA